MVFSSETLKEVMFQERFLLSCEKEDYRPYLWSDCRKYVTTVHNSPSGFLSQAQCTVKTWTRTCGLTASRLLSRSKWTLSPAKLEIFASAAYVREICISHYRQIHIRCLLVCICKLVVLQLSAKLRRMSQKQNTFCMDKVGDGVLTAHSVDCKYANLNWKIMFGLWNFTWI